MTPTREELGAQIKAARLSEGLSVRQAAEQLGIQFTYYSRIEKGTAPVGKHAGTIARFYGMDPEVLEAQAQGNLPNLGPYLRAKYDLSEDAVAELEQHFKEVTKKNPRPRRRS